MSYYNPDTVEWRSNGDNRVFYAQGLDEPDTAMIIHQILPQSTKDTWMYKVGDGEFIVRLHKIQHIYTAQQLAIKELNDLRVQRERKAALQAAGQLAPEREYAPYHPNSYGAKQALQPVAVVEPVAVVPDALAVELDEIEVNDPHEELGYGGHTVNSSPLADYFPRKEDGTPADESEEEVKARALRPSHKSTVSKVSKKGGIRLKEKTKTKA